MTALTTTPRTHLDGVALREMFAAATSWLEENAGAINAINVFPIPDGDTGTNMFLTMKATMEAAAAAHDDSASAVSAAMAEGALMGARGNSGVILSQIIRGLAAGMAGKEEVDAGEFADAMAEATKAAYKAVSNPIEGTILTVCREAGEAALRRSENPMHDVTDVLKTAADAAKDAVDATPALLPVLREAGVVDAGGQGLYVMFEGCLGYLQGNPRTSLKSLGQIDEGWLSQQHSLHQDGAFGYCTEFVLSGQGLSIEESRRSLEDFGSSVLVVGDQQTLHAHVHTSDPGKVLSYATALGNLVRVKVDNMDLQSAGLRAAAPAAAGPISVVAVGVGEGIKRVLRDCGAGIVVEGGQTMNPSTESLVEAIAQAPTDTVLLLPNNKNIVMAARQAAELTKDKRALVIESKSVPQGIAALLALSQDQPLEDNVQAMEEALRSVRSGEVCKAVRSVKLGPVNVVEGQYISMVDGELIASSEDLSQAVAAALERMAGEDTSLMTLYAGADVSPNVADEMATRAREAYPDHEVEVVRGDQPYYDYFISVE